MTEDELIATLFAPLAGPAGLGLKDDTALIVPEPGFDQVLTVDALVAGVHFFANDPPESIARKALRVNLSDLAAKGARPTGFLLAIALPAGWTPDWLRAFAQGLGEDGARFGCPLLGGDTVKTPGPLTLSITAFGTVPHGRMVPRTGAKAGDRLYVSGAIGDSALGLYVRLSGQGRGLAGISGHQRYLIDRYLHPEPRLGLAAALTAHASGSMDVSDGLVGDITKLLHASGVSARVRLSAVPLSAAGQAAIDAQPELFETALTGGDDYEILASVPPREAEAFEAAARHAGIPVTAIGEVEAGRDAPVFLDRDGGVVQFRRGSFSHF